MKMLRFAAFAATVFAAGYATAAEVYNPRASAKSASALWQECTADYISRILEEGRKRFPNRNSCIRISGSAAWARAIAHCGPRPTS